MTLMCQTFSYAESMQNDKLSAAMRGNTNGRGNLGGKRTPEQRATMGRKRGDNPTYTAVHKRLVRERGKPSLCEHCGTTTAKKFEWAYTGPGHELDRQVYSADLSTYIRLCTSCHLSFDGHPQQGRPKSLESRAKMRAAWAAKRNTKEEGG